VRAEAGSTRGGGRGELGEAPGGRLGSGTGGGPFNGDVAVLGGAVAFEEKWEVGPTDRVLAKSQNSGS